MVAKRIEIDRELRQRIINAKYPPGSRLPTRVELEKEFDVSSITIQRAVNLLVEDGFAVAKGREGTFATENPPHLSKIALLFPYDFKECIADNQFYRAFSNEAKSVAKRMNVSFEIIDNFENWKNMEQIQKLLDDVLEKRLAGIIFAAVPAALENTSILNHPDIARVGIMSRPDYGIPAVWHDDFGFYSKAIDYLENKSCIKPAFLIPAMFLENTSKFIMKYVDHGKIQIKSKYLQQFALSAREGVGNLLELIFDSGNRETPDSLVIGDDNILPIASKQLEKMGFNGEDDIKIVSLANFPWPTKSCLPVLRIGYEANTTLEICVNCIQKQLNGEIPEIMTTLPALYEYEIGEKP